MTFKTHTGEVYESESEWRDAICDPSIKRAIDEMVPWEWREVICHCYSCWGAPSTNNDGSPRPCNRCGKIRRVFFARCTGCKSWYVNLFTHSHKPRYDGKFDYDRYTKRSFRGACWECLVGYYGKAESDVPPPAWATPRKARDLEDLLADDTDIDLDFNIF